MTDSNSSINAARKIFKEKNEQLSIAMIPVIAEMTNGPLAQADKIIAQSRETLAQLAEVIPMLLAADLVRERLMKKHFVLPNGVYPPVAGGVIISRFLEELPDNLRPEGVTAAAFMPAARKIASAVIREIQGTENG